MRKESLNHLMPGAVGRMCPVVLTAFIVVVSLGPLVNVWDGQAYAFDRESPRSEVVPFPGDRPAMGEPTRHSPLGSGTEWEDFRHEAGPTWVASFNPITGTPHRAWGTAHQAVSGPVLDVSAAEAAARDFISRHTALLRCDPHDLEPVRVMDRGGRFIIVFRQTYAGIPVEGGRVDVRLDARGRVLLFGSDFYPGVDVSPLPTLTAEEAVGRAEREVVFDGATFEHRGAELRVLPIVRGEEIDYRLTYRVAELVRETPALWVTYVDAHTGQTLWRYDDLKYESVSGTVEADVQPATPTDPYVTHPNWNLLVKVTDQDSVHTDAVGYYEITVPAPGTYEVTAELRGLYANLNNSGGPDASFADSTDAGVALDIYWDDSNSQADERDCYFHVNVVHDSLKSWDPALTACDYSMPAQVSISATCNAYWDGVGVNFYAEGDGCANTGQIADVIYHEYGHGRTQWVFSPLGTSGSIHEGFSDYLACTITDQPDVGRGFLGEGTILRTLDNEMTYPDSLVGEVHSDGLIIGGSVWHMRQRFINLLGDHTTAVHLADSLWHFAGYAGAQNFYDYFIDLAMEDDDDGDLGNGTPHGIDIYQAFGRHGIGPGLYVAVEHDSLKDTEITGTPITIEATITSVMPLRTDSLRVYYRTHPPTPGPDWSEWQNMQLAPSAEPHLYLAAIPGQAEGTVVQYYLMGQSDTLDVTTFVPPEGRDVPYLFTVGADYTEPRIVHAPIPNQGVSEWPPTVTAIATDNVAVASVEVEYLKNDVPQPSLPLSPTVNPDEYSCVFPAGGAAGDLYRYRIKATDASSAANVAYWPLEGYYHIWVGDLLTLEEEDVEGGSPGWTHYVVTDSFVDQWHISDNRNHTAGGTYSWKFGGPLIFGKYASYADGALETPPIVLGDHSQLSFWHWMDAEEGGGGGAWDGGILEMTTNGGGDWEQVFPQVFGYTHYILDNPDSPFIGGTPCWSGTFDWTETVLDLSGYGGTVSFRFRFGSDGHTTAKGWHVDDLLVTGVDSPTSVNGAGGGSLPADYQLSQNQPNPFNPVTGIRFALPQGGETRITVFDVTGRVVRTLVDEVLPAGYHETRWDGLSDSGHPVASGVYFYRLEAEEFSATRKMTLLK